MIEHTSPRHERITILTKLQEELFADHLIHMSNIFYGLDAVQFRKIVYESVEKLVITLLEQRSKNNLTWVVGRVSSKKSSSKRA